MLNIDTITFNQQKAQRLNLARQLEQKGISDNRVLDAIRYLPRELFVPSELKHRAYEDNALPINENQTISQPYTVAYMTSLLNIKNSDKVLEIGTGSGYQAAIIYLLGGTVFSVERLAPLYNQSKELFRRLNVRVNLRLGDGSLGWRETAPYDSIIVTAASPQIPSQLIQQLKINGRLVVPVGMKSHQDMYLIIRSSENEYLERKLDSFKFVPLIGKEGWDN